MPAKSDSPEDKPAAELKSAGSQHPGLNPTESTQPTVPFTQLFRFAHRGEKYALVFSGVAAAALGTVFPLFSIGSSLSVGMPVV